MLCRSDSGIGGQRSLDLDLLGLTLIKLMIVILQVSGTYGQGGTRRDFEDSQCRACGQISGWAWYRNFELVSSSPITYQTPLNRIFEAVEAAKTGLLHLLGNEEVLAVPEFRQLQNFLRVIKVQVRQVVIVEASPSKGPH